ncbi:ribonuclease III [Chromatiales bacterium (ex Bugula neritina AB1)]|nr:ribonuclease III [Chromatiales bacterium (ex Bugula neritina AB1)]
MTDPDYFGRKLDHEFTDKTLLKAALTHRSAGSVNNERLEFLGDAMLNFVIAAEIFRLRPQYQEGQLSRLRANLVRGVTLAEIGRELALGDRLNLGSGELKSGGFNRDSILADAVEALIGAVYLDGGFESAAHTVCFLYHDRLNNLPPDEPLKDPKTRLQEYLQGRKYPVPEYQLIDTRGEAHQREFTVKCRIESLNFDIEAIGSSRRRAEQAAAQQALDHIAAKT